MNVQEYRDRWIKAYRDEWFKNHKADLLLDYLPPRTSEGLGSTCIITWQKPGTWNYGCRFIIHRRWLCVIGDIGEAVFEWGEDVTLEFLAQIDFGYFLSKCRASPHGMKFEEFDAEVAAHYRAGRIKELEETPDEDKSESDAKELEVLKGNDVIDKSQWDDVAKEYYDDTGDAEGASSISDWGDVPSTNAIGMFVGLQMAIAQLKKV